MTTLPIFLATTVILFNIGYSELLQRRQGGFPPIGNCTGRDVTSFLATNVTRECSSALFTVIRSINVDSNLATLNPDHVDLYITLCNARCGQKIVDFFVNCGRNVDFELSLCTMREDGTLCYEASVLAMNDTNRAVAECLPVTSSCSNTCRTELQNFRTNLGCCVNSFYNSTGQTFQPRNITTYALWSSCMLQTPGICESTLSAGNGAVSVAQDTLTFSICLLVTILVVKTNSLVIQALP